MCVRIMKRTSRSPKPGRDELRTEYRLDYGKARPNRFASKKHAKEGRGYTERKVAIAMSNEAPVVHSDPEILGGTPVFVGTRVPVKSLYDYLEAGDSLDEFLESFPSVTREQAVAALELARTMTEARATTAR